MSGKKKVDSFTVDSNIGSDKARRRSDGQYISVPLPDEVEEIGLKAGDKVYVDLDSEFVDDEEVHYLRYEKEEISRHDLSIRENEDLKTELYVRIPIEYTFHRESQSFHGLGKDEDLVVELDYVGDRFRVYRAEEYPYRLRQLSEQDVFPEMKSPGLAGLGSLVLNRLLVDQYAEITSIPSRVSMGESFEVGVAVEMPDLDRVIVQVREESEPGFTDVKSYDEIRGSELAKKFPLTLPERAVFEVRLWVHYGGGEAESSEGQTVEVL
jgi:hypothetical protein